MRKALFSVIAGLTLIVGSTWADATGQWDPDRQISQNGDRIVLASDRDFGLFIFRYTGPVP